MRKGHVVLPLLRLQSPQPLERPPAAELARTSRRVDEFADVASLAVVAQLQTDIHGAHHRRAPQISDRFAQRSERGPDLGAKQLRLFPGGEVPALIHLVEVDQIAIGASRPCLRGAIDVFRKYRDGDRE